MKNFSKIQFLLISCVLKSKIFICYMFCDIFHREWVFKNIIFDFLNYILRLLKK